MRSAITVIYFICGSTFNNVRLLNLLFFPKFPVSIPFGNRPKHRAAREVGPAYCKETTGFNVRYLGTSPDAADYRFTSLSTDKSVG